jgi:hypothetical protein
MNAAIDLKIAQAMGISGTDRGSETTLSQIATALGTLTVGATTYSDVATYVQAVKTAALGTMTVGSQTYSNVGDFVTAALGTMTVGSTTYDNVGAYVNAALGSLTVGGVSANNVGTYMENVLDAAEDYADTNIGSLTYTPVGGSSTDYSDMRSVLNAMFADASAGLGVFIAGTGDPTAANLTENDLYIKYSAS